MPEVLIQPRPAFIEAPRRSETIKVHPHSIIWIRGDHLTPHDLYHLHIVSRTQAKNLGPVKKDKQHNLVVIHPGAVVETTVNRRIIKFTNSFSELAQVTRSEGTIKYMDSRHYDQRTYTVSPDNPPVELPAHLGNVYWVEGDKFKLPVPQEPRTPMKSSPTFVSTVSAGGGK